jgi:hypothetical protein
MKRLSILFLAGMIAVLLQATLLAQLPGGSLKPDLLLIVILYIGFFLAPTEGGILSFVILDTFIMIGVLRFFGGGDYPVPEIGGLIWYRALLNAVAAPFVMMALFRAERRFNTIPKKGGLDLLS